MNDFLSGAEAAGATIRQPARPAERFSECLSGHAPVPGTATAHHGRTEGVVTAAGA